MTTRAAVSDHNQCQDSLIGIHIIIQFKLLCVKFHKLQ